MTASADPIPCREYGAGHDTIVLVHGGPAAAGYLAPVAKRLSEEFRVLEPFQREHADQPLTVASHVADLQRTIEQRCANRRSLIVGHSWGAMLAAIHAAEHPDTPCGIVLVCSGTFDKQAREELRSRIERRCDRQTQERLRALPYEVTDPDEVLERSAALLMRAYSHELVSDDLGTQSCSASAHHETWKDMMRLERAGVYPAELCKIRAPALMLHGDTDPHPAQLIRDGLRPHVPQLEFEEIPRCGHYPWLERHGAEPFFEKLSAWARSRFADQDAAG